jgi:hypothetical protein
MKYILIVLSFLFSISAWAQDCSESMLLQKPGSWEKNSQGSIRNVSAADLVKEKAILTNIHQMISSAYNPKGCKISYSTVFEGNNASTDKIWTADFFSYNMYILRYFCDNKSKFSIDAETPTTFTINANVIYSLNNLYAAEIPDDDMRGYLKLKVKPQKKDGYYFMGEEVVGNSDSENKTVEYRWLITYDDKLPFFYLSRKEYLLIQKKRLEKTIQDNGGTSDYYNKFMININKELLKPESELSQPAICMWNDEERFTGFVDEGTKGSFIAVKPNLDYYDKKLARSIPQFFTVVYTIAHGNQIYEENISAIQKAVDFSTLKSMLGKEPVKTVVQNNKTNINQTNIVKKEDKPNQNTFDVYKNEPTPGFKETPESEIKNVAQLYPAVDSKIKAKALSTHLTPSTLPGYLNNLLSDIEKNLKPQEQKNTQLLYAKMNNSPVDLADAGAMLYYKGAVPEALWCLSKAAAMMPTSDYILNNLTGIMNLAHTEARGLPILRYLKEKNPNNSTILNNLGQALYVLGELNQSKAVLDSCIRICAYHPQANFTRAIIAEKEGKNADSKNFIINSMKIAYSDEADEYAKRKGIKLDYRNMLNRYRPGDAEYINPRKFLPPSQCTNVDEAAGKEAEWEAWSKAVNEASQKMNAGLLASSENYKKDMEQFMKTKNSGAVATFGPLHGKADKLYKVFFDKAADLLTDMQFYMDHTYLPAKETAQAQRSASITSGDCGVVNGANNTYLHTIAALNDDFHSRFSEPFRQLNIEMMYWSQMLPVPSASRDMMYYERAIFAINPMIVKSEFFQPCQDNTDLNPGQKEMDMPAPYCPISFKFKFKVVKLNGDCGKFEIEIEYEGLVLNLERDFVNKKSTIALGAGVSLDFENKVDDVSKNVIVPGVVPEFVDHGGGGVGAKVQGFIEFGEDGISDLGLRGEAGIEGVGTDKGDLKISGKIGINSGVTFTPSPAVQGIANSINNSLSE